MSVEAAVNPWDTCTGLSGTITIDLPDCYAPIARDLIAALVKHAVYSGEVVSDGKGGQRRKVADALRGVCWAFRSKSRGGLELGGEIHALSADGVSASIAKAVRHLHAHVFGAKAPTGPDAERLEPTAYIERLAKD